MYIFLSEWDYRIGDVAEHDVFIVRVSESFKADEKYEGFQLEWRDYGVNFPEDVEYNYVWRDGKDEDSGDVEWLWDGM
jgi:hypothetical protein